MSVHKAAENCMFDKPIVLLFIKAPVKGQVKSRLAAAVGEEAAIELYQNFILDILDMVEKSSYPLSICVYPPGGVEKVSSWLGKERSCLPQKGGDLGERMGHALQQAFSEGRGRAVLIGSDIPDLPSGIIGEAFEALTTNDAVIGPATDGGYYLIGFNSHAFSPRFFRDIEWSTSGVFRETMNILRGASLRVHLMPQWHDVDTLDDLKELCARGRGQEFDKSRTMAYLRMHKNRLFSDRRSLRT